MSTSSIALVIDSMQRYRFMSRLGDSLKRFDVLYVTSEPLAYFLLSISGRRVKYLIGKKKKSTDQVGKHVVLDSENSIEYLNGIYSLSECTGYYISIYSSLTELQGIDKFVVWNGQHLLGRVLSRFCKNNGIRMQYLEISNLPNLLFSDPEGVNANSSLAKKPAILDGFPSVGDDDFYNWVEEYKESKKKPIPQAKSSFSNKLQSLLNWAAKKVFPSVLKYPVLKKKDNVALRGLVGSCGGALYEGKGDYVFIPLQVSSDTQIKLHSDVDNMGLIEYGSELKKSFGVDIVVKIHPAETDVDHVKSIVCRAIDLGMYFSFENTTDLILGSNKVVAINSTVGLEAMIFGKDVETLGRSHYSEFDNERLKKYIFHYLVSGVDYFSLDSISVDSAEKAIGECYV